MSQNAHLHERISPCGKRSVGPNSLPILLIGFAAACNVYNPGFLDMSPAADSGDTFDSGQGRPDGGGAGDSGGSGGAGDEDGAVVEDAGRDAGACEAGGGASCPLICREVCDGEDNDCDDEVDEGDPWVDKGQLCLIGEGECRVAGVFACNDSDHLGPLVCDATPKAGEAEACDGLDNDCDGDVDEEFADSDGDGVADCVDPNDAGVDAKQRKKITITAGTVDADLASFPVLVRIAGDAELQSDTRTDFRDISFLDHDASTPLSFEVETFSRSDGHFTAWVKVPAVSSSSDTVFYLRYGDGADHWNTASGYNQSDVWSNGYLRVYHLQNVAAITDSAGGNTGANSGAVNIGGLIGGAAGFNGSSSYLHAAHAPIDGTSFTVSAWTKRDVIDQTQYVMGQGTDTAAIAGKAMHFGYENGAGGLNHVRFSFYYDDLDSSGSYTDTTNYEYWICTYSVSGNARAIYRNGSLVASDSSAGSLNTSGDFEIGRRLPFYDFYWDGTIDEVRVSSAARSAAWIKAEYDNQRSGSTFLTVETE